MVKTTQIYKDLDEICRLTNSIYFNYTHLTTKNLTPGSLFNLDDFLIKTQKFLGNTHIDILKKYDIIRPAPYGMYHINFNPRQYNGLAYGIPEIEGTIFFFKNDLTFANKVTMYHEAAHGLQYTQDLFDEQKISRIYNFLDKGLKIAPDNSLVEFVIDESCYKNYLGEMHSEAFASACMLMRSNSAAEFARTSFLLLRRGSLRTIDGLKSKDNDYPSSKYYASLPVLKAVIRQVSDWRKNGFPKEISARGKINFEQLSLKISQIVWDRAYSPQVFKQYMNKEWFLHRKKSDNSWEKDALQALPFYWFQKMTHRKSRKSGKTMRKDREKSFTLMFSQLPETSDENCGINFLRNVESALYFTGMENDLINDKLLFLNRNIEKAIENGVLLPYDTVKAIFTGSKAPEYKVKSTFAFLNEALLHNKNNEWLKSFAYEINQNCADDYEVSAKLREIYDQKLSHPEKDVFNVILFTGDREDYSNNDKEVKNDVLNDVADIFYTDKPFRGRLSKLIGSDNFAALEKELFKYQHNDGSFLFLSKETDKLKEFYRPSFIAKGQKTYYPEKSKKYMNYAAAFDEEIRALQNLYFENNDSLFFREFMKKMEKMPDYNAETVSAAVKNERKKLISSPIPQRNGIRYNGR